MFKSNGTKEILKNNRLFGKYRKTYQQDKWSETTTYKNDEIEIVFSEELREHVLNMIVSMNKIRIAEIYFKNVIIFSNNLCGNDF
ncbi:MAG: hypothetical protein LBR37_00790 [Erysipelotrichaceae bacterium]|jgi:hypothetical protein|nr:hypothetical protein [Erysipelotrichaceae bacterium]